MVVRQWFVDKQKMSSRRGRVRRGDRYLWILAATSAPQITCFLATFGARLLTACHNNGHSRLLIGRLHSSVQQCRVDSQVVVEAVPLPLGRLPALVGPHSNLRNALCVDQPEVVSLIPSQRVERQQSWNAGAGALSETTDHGNALVSACITVHDRLEELRSSSRLREILQFLLPYLDQTPRIPSPSQ